MLRLRGTRTSTHASLRPGRAYVKLVGESDGLQGPLSRHHACRACSHRAKSALLSSWQHAWRQFMADVRSTLLTAGGRSGLCGRPCMRVRPATTSYPGFPTATGTDAARATVTATAAPPQPQPQQQLPPSPPPAALPWPRPHRPAGPAAWTPDLPAWPSHCGCAGSRVGARVWGQGLGMVGARVEARVWGVVGLETSAEPCSMARVWASLDGKDQACPCRTVCTCLSLFSLRSHANVDPAGW